MHYQLHASWDLTPTSNVYCLAVYGVSLLRASDSLPKKLNLYSKFRSKHLLRQTFSVSIRVSNSGLKHFFRHTLWAIVRHSLNCHIITARSVFACAIINIYHAQRGARKVGRAAAAQLQKHPPAPNRLASHHDHGLRKGKRQPTGATQPAQVGSRQAQLVQHTLLRKLHRTLQEGSRGRTQKVASDAFGPDAYVAGTPFQVDYRCQRGQLEAEPCRQRCTPQGKPMGSGRVLAEKDLGERAAASPGKGGAGASRIVKETARDVIGLRILQMQALIRLISQRDIRPAQFVHSLAELSDDLNKQVEALEREVSAVDMVLEKEEIPQLTEPTCRFLGLDPSLKDKKGVVVALLTQPPSQFEVQLAKYELEIECIDRLQLMLRKRKEFEQTRLLSRQIELLNDIDKLAYRYLCEKLKNEQLLARVASIVTKCRHSVDSRLSSLTRRDSTSITYSISEICSVAHLITNPDVLNHLVFCGYEQLLQYSATTNEITVAKLTAERTDRHVTLAAQQMVFNSKQELGLMLHQLASSMSVLQTVEREIVPFIREEHLLAQLSKTRKSVLLELAEEISPMFYFMSEQEHARATKLLECDPVESECPAVTKLLMKLKHSIHKADHIDAVAASLIELLLKQVPSDFDRLFYFLESEYRLNKNQHSNLGMYLINAVLEQLEDKLEQPVVWRLLGLREQLRKQIYERFGRN